MSNRQRGVILTDWGKERLEAAIALAQNTEKYGKLFTQVELENRTGLSIKTIKKIRSCRIRTDEASVCALFKAFSLELEASDYGLPEEEQTTFGARSTNAKSHSDSTGVLSGVCHSRLDISTKLVSANQITQTEHVKVFASTSNEIFKLVRDQCCEKILQLYSEIQLLNHCRIKVEKIYVDTFLLQGLESSLFATISDLVKSVDPISSFDRLGLGSRKERLSGLDVPMRFSKLMVLGKPGAGKSTYLRFLAVACSQGKIFPDKIPILVELRHLKNFETFNLRKIVYEEIGLEDNQQIEAIFKNGNFFILLDGLDEVSKKQRQAIQKNVDIFVKTYYKNRLVITCRTQTTEYLMDQFTYVEVANFNLDQIKTFSHNWFVSQFGSLGVKLHESFMNKLCLSQNKQTAELASTPILLSLICWIYSDTRDLPEQKYKLYEKGLDLLLEKWDERKGIYRETKNQVYKALSKKDKQKLLSFVALKKFKEDQRILFENDEICAQIAEFLKVTTEDAYKVLKDIEFQHGIIVERAQEIYSFSHLTFQEFFAAQAIAEDFTSNSFQACQAYFGDQQWREIFILLFSMIKKPDHIFFSIKNSIDAPIINNSNLREFIGLLKQKMIYVRSTKKFGVLRVKYLNLILEILPNFENVYDSGILLSQSLADDPNKSFSLDYEFLNSLEFALNKVQKTLALRGNYVNEVEEEFISSLNLLKQKLPRSSENFLEWWLKSGDTWIQNLKYILDEYMEIGRYWKFTHHEKDLISKYNYSNELLLTCIDLSDFVSDETKEMIKDSLLNVDPN